MPVSKRMKRIEGSVVLCRVGRFCRDVMDTAGFLSFLPVFDTLEEAVACGRLRHCAGRVKSYSKNGSCHVQFHFDH